MLEHLILHTYPIMGMEQCSETSAYKIQTLGNYPEEGIQHSEHGESLKSRIILSYHLFPCLPRGLFPRCFPVVLVLPLFTGSKQVSFPKQQQLTMQIIHQVIKLQVKGYKKLLYDKYVMTSHMIWTGSLTSGIDERN